MPCNRNHSFPWWHLDFQHGSRLFWNPSPQNHQNCQQAGLYQFPAPI